MWTPPTTTRRGDGSSNSTKSSDAPAVMRPVGPPARAARADARASSSGVPAVAPSSKTATLAPSRPSGPADHGRNRGGAFRGEDVAQRLEERRGQGLHEDLDGSAAGQAHAPRRIVGDTEVEQSRLSAGENLDAGRDHGAFDASAAHRSRDPAIARNRHLAAHGPRGRAPGLDDGGQRDREPLRAPALDVGEDVSHAVPSIRTGGRVCCRRSGRSAGTRSRCRASASRLARLWEGRKSSTYGSAARMPRASGS